MITNVDIERYHPVNKGSFAGSFTLVIQPQGFKIRKCKYFVSGEKHWFKFPDEEIKKDGATDYIPLMSVMNKDYLAQLNTHVLAQLQKTKQEASNATQGNTQAAKTGSVSSQPPVSWKEPPV